MGRAQNNQQEVFLLPQLKVFVLAKPASGKNIVSLSKYLAYGQHERIRAERKRRWVSMMPTWKPTVIVRKSETWVKSSSAMMGGLECKRKYCEQLARENEWQRFNPKGWTDRHPFINGLSRIPAVIWEFFWVKWPVPMLCRRPMLSWTRWEQCLVWLGTMLGVTPIITVLLQDSRRESWRSTVMIFWKYV